MYLLLYATSQGDSTEFQREAERVSTTLDCPRVEWGTGRDIIAGIERFTDIRRCIIFCHGGSTILFWRPQGGQSQGGIKSNLQRSNAQFITVDDFAAALGPRMGARCVIGLAACSAGMGPDEARDWAARGFEGAHPGSTDPRQIFQWKHGETGQGSIACSIRDKLKRYRSAGDFEVRAHRIAGHTTRNPNGITFYGNHAVGSPGRSLACTTYGPPDETQLNVWLARHEREWQGPRAAEWVVGGGPVQGEGGGRNAYELSFFEGAPGGASPVTPAVGGESFRDTFATGGTTEIRGGELVLDRYEIPERTELHSSLRSWSRARLDELS